MPSLLWTVVNAAAGKLGMFVLVVRRHSHLFYVFRIPAAWQPFMSFNCGVFHPPGLGRVQRLCAKVLGMGWLSSVGVAQHLIRELALRAPRLGADLPLRSELRRDCAPPRKRERHGGERFWSVYMDDFDVAEAGEKEEVLKKVGEVHEWSQALRDAYSYWGKSQRKRQGLLPVTRS